jgi:hypothetical protein
MKRLVGLFLIVLFGVMFVIKMSPAAHAAPYPGVADCGNPIRLYQRCIGQGYFTGTTNYLDGTIRFPLDNIYSYSDPGGMLATNKWAVPNVAFDSKNNHAYAVQFTSLLENYINNYPAGVARDHTNSIGAAMVIDAMLSRWGTDYANPPCANDVFTPCYLVAVQAGIDYAKNHHAEWESMVYAFDDAGMINWNTYGYFGGSHPNTTAINGGSDVEFFDNTDPEFFAQIVITDNVGNQLFQINRSCGNIVGVPLTLTPPPPRTFTITPTAQPPTLNDNEAPTTATFNTGVTVGLNGPVIASTTREYTATRGALTLWTVNPGNDINHKFNLGSYNYATDVRVLPVLQAGDKVCVVTTVNPSSGTVDVGGNVTNPGGVLSSGSVCTTVVAKPYIKAFGNDVSAGAGFSVNGTSSCTATNDKSTILTIGKNGLGIVYTGAGSQLGVFALGEISNFVSASGRNRANDQTIPSAPVGLTFGNYGTPSISKNGTYSGFNGVDHSQIDGYGGKSSISRCIPDYYGKAATGGATIDSATTTKTYNDSTALPDAIEYTHANSYVQIDGLSSVSGQHVIAVNGDVYITNNINYAGYGDVGGIPSLYIIATGNVYVKSNVTNLSGVYVAQQRTNPDGTLTTGNISTCAITTAGRPTSVTGPNLFNNCSTQLTVNGAFVAKHIQLLRTFSSLKNSNNGETAASNNAAESFASSPEMYLSVPQVFRTSPPYGTYDSITSLPPIL